MNRLIAALCAAFAAIAPSAADAANAAARLPHNAPVQHVLLVSVDGLHANDLARYVEAHPASTLAQLAAQGIDYTNAHTVAPADSFPGLLALVTGGTPAATGVYYDDSYDRALIPAGGRCNPTGAASATGARVRFDESLDKDDGHGHTILDAAKLPRDPRHGCAPVFPHAYLRVNTAFEAVRDAGGYTAWIDKHPTYELIEGPSGHGVNDLFLPEIGGNYEGLNKGLNDVPNAEAKNPRQTHEITGSLARTEAYDDMKARAVINEIDGRTHAGNAAAAVPNLFGLNLQSVNVAQKLYGYRDADGALTPGLDDAIGHIDGVLHSFVAELERRHLRDDTLVIVTAKHGNGPIDPARLRKIDEATLIGTIDAAAPGELAQVTTDHGALVWLRDAGATPAVADALRAQAARLGIAEVLSGEPLALRFPSPGRDSRTPDIVIVSRDGVIFARPDDGKLAEHGGFHDDDTHVALLVSTPKLAGAGRSLTWPVSTTQVAPTMLAALGLQPDALEAVRLEGTATLPGLDWAKAKAKATASADAHVSAASAPTAN